MPSVLAFDAMYGVISGESAWSSSSLSCFFFYFAWYSPSFLSFSGCGDMADAQSRHVLIIGAFAASYNPAAASFAPHPDEVG